MTTKYIILYMYSQYHQGRSQDFVFGGGGSSDKISRKVSKILVRSGDIQKSLLNKDLKILKSYINIAQKFIKIFQILKKYKLKNFKKFSNKIKWILSKFVKVLNSLSELYCKWG